MGAHHRASSNRARADRRAGRERARGRAEQLERDAGLADALRVELGATGWDIVNDTPLPVVCFADPGAAAWEHHSALAQAVVDGGRAWISPVRLDGRAALRACVISHRTASADIEGLVHAVNDAREAMADGPSA